MKLILTIATVLFAQISFAAPKTFKMYSQPDAKPNKFCDHYTELKMENQGTNLKVDLVNRLSGACEIFVDPDPRSYTAMYVENECGTKVYEARDNNTGKVVFRLSDNRTRLCDDIVLALIEVTELDSKQIEYPLYSKDR